MLIIYYMSNSNSDSETKKLTRLSEVRYRKTGNEVQSNLTQEDINLLLEEYEEVNDVTTELKTGIHIRYYSLVKDKDKKKRGDFKKLFRLGGTIIKIDPEFKYVVLTNGKLSWCVQLENTIIYKKMSIKDIKDFYENELDVKDDIIKRKDKKIGKLKEIVEQLLEENKVMKKYIKSL